MMHIACEAQKNCTKRSQRGDDQPFPPPIAAPVDRCIYSSQSGHCTICVLTTRSHGAVCGTSHAAALNSINLAAHGV